MKQHQKLNAVKSLKQSEPLVELGIESGRPQSPDLSQYGRVAVIGAGPAGLKCAVGLNELGIDVDVFEAQSKIGGRIQSRVDSRGIIFEDGGHLINDDHLAILRDAEKYNLELTEYYPEEQGSCLLGYNINEIDRDRTEIAIAIENLTADLRSALELLSGPDAEHYINKFSNLNLEEYLNSVEIPQWAKDTLSAHVKAELGAGPKDVDTLTFMGFQYEKMTKENPRWVFSGYGRFSLAEGMSSLTKAYASEIQDKIHTEHALKAIRKVGEEYYLVFSHNGETSVKVYDYLALCLPYSALKNVDLSESGFKFKRIRAINELPYGKEEKINFESTQVPHYNDPDADVILIDDFDGGNPAYVWNNKRDEGASGDVVRSVFASDMPALKEKYGNEDVIAEVGRSKLRKILPNTYNGKAHLSNWGENEYIGGSYSTPLPGQTIELLDGFSSKENNRVFFGGEHIGLGKGRKHAAFMNGAVESGDYMKDQLLGNMVLNGPKIKSAA